MSDSRTAANHHVSAAFPFSPEIANTESQMWHNRIISKTENEDHFEKMHLTDQVQPLISARTTFNSCVMSQIMSRKMEGD